MNSETADTAGHAAVALPGARAGWRPLAALRADAERLRALRDCWQALWASRLLVWAAGAGTVLAFGFGPRRGALDPPGMTRGFGRLGDLLAAPAARWDSDWYLVIAHYGYRPDLGSAMSPRDAFFPLYPLALRGLSWLGPAPILAGVMISIGAFALALYGIHRLTSLELAGGGAATQRAARLAVLLTAFSPMAFFFSAVYSEALYLALSVGLFWSARNGRWALAGILGGLAAATRSTGLLLLVPALVLYFYGPRRDRPADRPAGGLRPAYRPRAELLWLALIPAAVAAYAGALALGGGDALAPFHAQNVWGRHFAGPYLGVWDGLQAAFEGARQLLSFQQRTVYFPAAPGSPSVAAEHNLMLFAFLLVAIPPFIAAWRRLPRAYCIYVLAALALPLSYPVPAQPLMSLPRFEIVLFPLAIGAGAWLSEHPRAVRPLIVTCACLMAVFTAQFATWHWVA